MSQDTPTPDSSEESPTPHPFSSPQPPQRTDAHSDEEYLQSFDRPSHELPRQLSRDQAGPSSALEEGSGSSTSQGAVAPDDLNRDGGEYTTPSRSGDASSSSSRGSSATRTRERGKGVAQADAPEATGAASTSSNSLAMDRTGVSDPNAAESHNIPSPDPVETDSSASLPTETVTLPPTTAGPPLTRSGNNQSPSLDDSTRAPNTLISNTSVDNIPRGTLGRPSPLTRQHSPPEFVLPRWQPDAEVTYCPICQTQFSIFVRKHHCRKCGRVVCNSCSPHRITIPYQYIVRPPGQEWVPAPGSMSPQGGRGGVELRSLVGGDRVRLCNPCVPDPNTAPPQAASPSLISPRSHSRSQSLLGSGGPGNAPSPRLGFIPSPVPNDAYLRNRSVTFSPHANPSSRTRYDSTENRILSGTPPVYYPAASSSHPPYGRHYRGGYTEETGASSSSVQRELPPPPIIAEEDECPVCHRELPSRALPNFESLREAHITTCITAHSAYGSTSASPEVPGSAEGRLAAQRTTRRTGMFPYLATEKDCVDSAECTICLEEFEVGVPMARLECLCRFHRSCISAWFVNHPGRCPVHQHDSFGY